MVETGAGGWLWAFSLFVLFYFILFFFGIMDDVSSSCILWAAFMRVLRATHIANADINICVCMCVQGLM